MSHPFKFDVVGMTDTGQTRHHNEDSIGWDIDRNLIVLADGMGGHSAGDVASNMAVDGILQAYRLPTSSTVSEVAGIVELIDHINGDIFRRAQENPDCARMGTTLVMACLVDRQVTVAHIGDSRVYRWRSGEIEQLTEDHSLVSQLIEQGAMSKDDAENSRYKHVITRALGAKPSCDADIKQYSAMVDDVYLMCSDGLSNKISDEVMSKTLDESDRDWRRAAQVLVDLANQAGGEDNISVVLAVVTTAS